MEVLHSIWDLADSGDQGALNREQFFGALRHGTGFGRFSSAQGMWDGSGMVRRRVRGSW